MAEEHTQFRGAAFGGFNRQDVLNYLKKLETEHEQTVSGLRTELDELKHSRAEDRRRLEELEEKFAQEQKRGLALQETLEKVEADLEQTSATLHQVEEELALLSANFLEIEPKAAAYNRLKERTAAIELDAHERAQETLDRAREEFAQIKGDCVRWVREIREGYDRMRTDLNGAFTQSSGELERICRLFEQVSQDFDVQDSVVQELLQKAEEIDVGHQGEVLVLT